MPAKRKELEVQETDIKKTCSGEVMLHTWYVQPKVHHGDFSATLAASLASETRPTLKDAVFFRIFRDYKTSTP